MTVKITRTEPGHRIEKGQEYVHRDPIRMTITHIRVLEAPVPWWDGTGKVRIATLLDDGRLIRPRYIAVRQLHDNPNRRGGYLMVRNSDGSPAGDAS